MLIDTHCHLDFPEFNLDREEVIKRSKKNGIDYIINIGSSLEGSEKSVELSNRYDFLYATVGLHPHEADSFDSNSLNRLKELAKQEKVVAIGETGLDFYKGYSSKENQERLFRSLIDLAKAIPLPLVIHNRLAQDVILEILRKLMPLRAVIHCFSGDEHFLKECLSLCFYISFTCNITYKKAGNLRALAKQTPLERLLLETDAPFLPPEGFRGKRNEPMFVKLLAEEIARIKEINIEEVAKVTTDNTKHFFDIR